MAKAISYGAVKRMIEKSSEFKEFQSEFVRRLNLFSEYPDAVDVTVSGCLIVVVNVRQYGWEDLSFEIPVAYSTRSLIAKRCKNSSDISELVVKNIIVDIVSGLNKYHECEFSGSWQEITSVHLKWEPDKYAAPRIFDFIAWDDKRVAVWHVEQECGEGWIILPTTWNQHETILHRDIDLQYKK